MKEFIGKMTAKSVCKNKILSLTHLNPDSVKVFNLSLLVSQKLIFQKQNVYKQDSKQVSNLSCLIYCDVPDARGTQ